MISKNSHTYCEISITKGAWEGVVMKKVGKTDLGNMLGPLVGPLGLLW